MKKKKAEKYYKCPESNSITTNSEILDECSNGGWECVIVNLMKEEY